jgi:hypothetical protein
MIRFKRHLFTAHSRCPSFVSYRHSYSLKIPQPEAVIIATNRSTTEQCIPIPAAAIAVRDGQELLSLNGANSNPKVTSGQVVLVIKPKTANAYQIIFRLESARFAPLRSR